MLRQSIVPNALPLHLFAMRVIYAAFLALFILTATISAAISYHPSAAWTRFALFMLGVVIALALSRFSHSILRIVFTSCGLFAIYYLFANDWSFRLGKLPSFDPMLHALTNFGGFLPRSLLHPNTAGGVIAMLLPFQFTAMLKLNNDAHSLRMSFIRHILLIPFISLLASAAVLLFTLSRGAWLALVIVATLACVWLIFKNRRAFAFAILSLAVAFIAFVILYGFDATIDLLWSGRGSNWRDHIQLIPDYWLTGVGFDGFSLTFSSYVMLVHVLFMNHAHNLYLNLWLFQGLFGLVAFVGMIVVLARQNIVMLETQRISKTIEGESLWRLAGLCSLGVILIHGLFDDPFHGNDGALISLLFIPLGVLMRAFSKEPWRTQAAIRFALSAVAFAAVFVCVIAFVPRANAAWQANLGALRQTQIELSRYQIDTYQTWGMQDKLRKTLDLSDAKTHYEAALKADTSNAVAHRRLGQIALTMGEYDLAREHLEASFSTDPNHRATRQLLGEIYALSGDLEQASQIWQSLRAEQGQLESRFNWHEFFIEDHASAARVRAAIDLTQSQSKK